MKKVLMLLMMYSCLAAGAQPTADIINYINTYKDLAMSEMQRSGVPAAITLAQGIHETYAGKSDLVLKSNNHFGIKCKSEWTGDKVYHDDDARGECFRSYSSPEDSYIDHSDFLKRSPRYAFLFNLDPTDYKDWAYGLKKAGYATNKKYSEILIKLIEDFSLEQYTLIALGRISPKNEILVNATDFETPIVPDDMGGVLPETQTEANPVVQYPSGEFQINRTRVIFARGGTSLLSIAEEYGVSYGRLIDFNDITDVQVLEKDQLVFLQRKRKVGSNPYHTVRTGERLYDISQEEGIRLESLIGYNLLSKGMEPAPGTKLNLQHMATTRPPILSESGTESDSDLGSFPAQNDTVATHIVQSSETLYSISKKYGVDVDKIRQWNRINGTGLKVGQQLVILKN